MKSKNFQFFGSEYLKNILKKINLFVILGVFLVLFSNMALADGGFFPPVYYEEDIYEPTQKGIIFYDGTLENLILQVTYEGNTTDFAWVVPVPSYPDVNKSNSYLFEELHFLTEPDYKRAPNFFFGRAMMIGGERLLADKTGVTLHEQKQVGLYEVSILSAEDPMALINWLNDNNYSISSKAEEVIDFYVQKDWYFIAMRINLAPYEENLITSLQKINPSITNSENAVTLLTAGLVASVKSEILYDNLGVVPTTILDYGEDDDELMGDYRNRPSTPKPTLLITENEYNLQYEQYNGYFDEHIMQEVKTKIDINFLNEIAVPFQRACYARGYDIDPDSKYKWCDVWYYTKDSDEYQLLKDVDCGKYCDLISSEKEKYTLDDFATVGANAAMEEDASVLNYFNVNTDRDDWYDNQGDIFKDVERDISRWLERDKSGELIVIRAKLTSELLIDYSQSTDQSFGSIEEVSVFLAERTLEDFDKGNSFSSSYVYGYGIITNADYINLKNKHDGDHNEGRLASLLGEKVIDVVNWKQMAVQRKLSSGTIHPLSIEFKTQEIIYPLKISSVNHGATEILLYVFAKHRTKVEGIKGFEVEYAKWIEPEDIKTDAYYRYVDDLRNGKIQEMGYPYYYRNPNAYYHLNQILDDRYFLTKFRKEMWPKEMTDDLVLAKESHNREYRLTVYEPGYIFSWILFFIGLAIMWGFVFGFFFGPRFLNNKIFKKNKKSPWYVTIRRSGIYAAVVVVYALLISIFTGATHRFFTKIGEAFGDLFEFIFHLFNYIGLPEVINAILVFIIALIFVFALIHIIGVGVVGIYKKIKK